MQGLTSAFNELNLLKFTKPQIYRNYMTLNMKTKRNIAQVDTENRKYRIPYRK